MNQKRAILFDVDGVLIHSMFHPDLSRRRRWDQHMKEDLGVDPKDFAGFFAERFGPIIRGQKSLVAELEDFLPSVGYTGSPLDFLAYWLKNDTHLNLPLLDAIKQLARDPGVKLYLATNQEHLRAFHLWHNLERFQDKWTRLSVSITRQNKDLEPSFGSTKTQEALYSPVYR